MFQGFYTGISGMLSHQSGIDSIANNASNINTIGYKGHTTEFKTIFDNNLIQTGAPMANTVGIGSVLSATKLDLAQGNLQQTEQPFDLALNGEGWFGVQNGLNTYFTRNGAFTKDEQGFLVDAGGQYLLGTNGNNIAPGALTQQEIDAFGSYYPLPNPTNPPQPYELTPIDTVDMSVASAQSPIQLPDFLYYPPRGTQNVEFIANLDPEVIVDLTSIPLVEADYTAAVDTVAETLTMSGGIANSPGIQSPEAGDTVLVSIIDPNGREVFASGTLQSDMTWSIIDHDISELSFATIDDLAFSTVLRSRQEIPNEETFNVGIFSPEGDKEILHMEYVKQVPQSTSGTLWDAQFQIRKFFEDYNPSSTYDPALYVIENEKVYEIIDEQSGRFSFASDGQMISETMPDMNNDGVPLSIDFGSGYVGLISMTQGSVNTVSNQDGYTTGYLKDYGLDGNNQIIAEFSNGRTSPIARLAVYHFQNDEGLSKLSGTYFAASENSGDPIFYTDENGNYFESTQIVDRMLENSNVNFASAMSELIVMQRAYAANAKSITTTDQMLQKALQM